MAYVAEQVSPQKKVRLVEEIDEIPKSASGKILRRVLRDRDPDAARPTATGSAAESRFRAPGRRRG